MFGAGTILDVSPAAAGDEHRMLESLGHRVIVCERPGDVSRCPLVEEGSCVFVDAADGVVFRLNLDEPYHREMLRRYRDGLGQTAPMHVVVSAGQEQRHAKLLNGMSVSVDEIGSALSRFSSEVTMAAAARSALSEPADLAGPFTEHSLAAGG